MLRRLAKNAPPDDATVSSPGPQRPTSGGGPELVQTPQVRGSEHPDARVYPGPTGGTYVRFYQKGRDKLKLRPGAVYKLDCTGSAIVFLETAQEIDKADAGHARIHHNSGQNQTSMVMSLGPFLRSQGLELPAYCADVEPIITDRAGSGFKLTLPKEVQRARSTSSDDLQEPAPAPTPQSTQEAIQALQQGLPVALVTFKTNGVYFKITAAMSRKAGINRNRHYRVTYNPATKVIRFQITRDPATDLRELQRKSPVQPTVVLQPVGGSDTANWFNISFLQRRGAPLLSSHYYRLQPVGADGFEIDLQRATPSPYPQSTALDKNVFRHAKARQLSAKLAAREAARQATPPEPKPASQSTEPGHRLTETILTNLDTALDTLVAKPAQHETAQHGTLRQGERDAIQHALTHLDHGPEPRLFLAKVQLFRINDQLIEGEPRHFLVLARSEDDAKRQATALLFPMLPEAQSVVQIQPLEAAWPGCNVYALPEA